MPSINIQGTNYSEFFLPGLGSISTWELHTWAGHSKMSNGSPNPFLGLPMNLGLGPWAVKMAPYGVALVGDQFAVALCTYLKTFPVPACPVDTGDKIEVENVGPGLYQFRVVVPANKILPAAAPTPPMAAKRMLAVLAHVELPKCICGAAKTYRALPGSSLHSSWCDVAEK